MKNKISHLLMQTILAALNVGVVLAGAHGTYALAAASSESGAPELAKIQLDQQHIHNDLSSTFRGVNVGGLIDPKSLRRVRSDGGKSDDSDHNRNGWDAYCA
ncbi:MAG: hypothetical protein LBM73_03115 [Candidatus Nomurabacteria bacterium]|jgi:hypothetical protein|nr:hypothetical protein [Candidatus Nomurabacteria bacterium]